MKKIIVQKFGGTSVASVARIEKVAQICRKSKEEEDCDLVVVVSAMGKATDELLSLMRQINPNPPAREQDMLLSSGEQVSVAVLSAALDYLGCAAQSFTGWQAGIKTEATHKTARIENIDTRRLRSCLNGGSIPVVAGFQGICEGEITTLGRGGSDTTAVALAVALRAERCDIYTDVDGVHTTDPRLVETTQLLEAISYDEMLELASLGAQVLHPRSVETAKNYDLPLRVRSSWHTDNAGTIVVNREHSMLEKQKTVRGVALDREQARLAIVGVPDEPGIAHTIFGELAKLGISVDVIVQCVSRDGATEVDFTVARQDARKAYQFLQRVAREINARSTSIDEDVVKVSIVGAGMINQSGIAARMFDALGQEGINIQLISTSEIRISCIVDEPLAEKAVQVVHDAFDLGKD